MSFIKKTKNIFKENKQIEMPFQFGDVVFAKRYESTDQEDIIPIGHRVGPYIIVGKNQDKYICLKGTHTLKLDKIKQNAYFAITDNYGLSGQTFFYYFQIKDYDSILAKIGQLDREDLQTLKEMIYTNALKGNFNFFNIDFEKSKIELGDIVERNNERYIVVNLDGNTYTLCNIKKSSLEQNDFIISEEPYYLDFDELIIVDNIDNYKKIDCISKEEVKSILEESKKNKEKINNNVIDRGSFIENDNNIYYIYGEEGTYFLTLEVYLEKGERLTPIYINNKMVYMDFTNESKIQKQDIKNNYSLVYNAPEREIQEIKQKRKLVKQKNKKSKKNQKNLKKITRNFGEIITDSTMHQTKYIVISKSVGNLVVIDYENYLNGNYELIFIPSNNIKVVGRISDDELSIILNNIKDISYGFINHDKVKILLKKFG